jgi:iron complex transport system ATP-binding protein
LKSVLEVRDLKFSYAWPVLDGVSFEAGQGELLVVLGPNGAGKSTLLKVIVGILKPAGGQILLDGRDLTSMPRRRVARLIGYVAQESDVRFPLTVLEFVLQGRFAHGRLLGFESAEDLQKARWAMEVTGTTRFALRSILELSGGERQRVFLARALSGGPRLLVLDEPVANLDISHQVKAFDLLRRLAAECRISAIVVTHELNLASEFASRILMLKSGRVLACGPPPKVMTEELLGELFDAELMVDLNPVSGAPRVTPIVPGRNRGYRLRE